MVDEFNPKLLQDDFALLQNYLNVSRETLIEMETWQKFEAYLALLLKWHPKINLVGPSTLKQLWTRHVYDAITLHHELSQMALDPNSKIIDIGSGGGIPGIGLMILGWKNITLVDSDQRKTIFLQQVNRELGLGGGVKNARIETLDPQLKADVIVARACAPLVKLLAWTQNIRHDHSIMVVHKGDQVSREIDDARQFYQAEYTPISVHNPGDGDSYIVKIKAIKSL